MKNLLWREFHWNRVIVVAAAVIFLLPYTIVLSLILWPRQFPLSWHEIGEGVAYGAFYSLIISQITVAFLAGNAFAGERSDRTAEFLAYLPISGNQRLAGKLLFAGIVIGLIWGINWPVLRALANPAILDLSMTAKYTATSGLVIFGVAWCFSSFLTSPTVSVSAGIAVPMMIMLSLQIAQEAQRPQTKMAARNLFDIGYPVAAIALGATGFALGTWLFLKRVGP